MKSLACFVFLFALVASAQQYTRGVGVYPGDPSQYTGPSLRPDAQTYRNLALHRAAYQSSAYDYNLTAQLVTDGIKSDAMPDWISTSTSDAGELPKTQREVFLDGNVTSSVELNGDTPWVQVDLKGAVAPEIDRVVLHLRKIYGRALPPSWTYTVLGSDDDVHWSKVGVSTGAEWPDMRQPGPSFSQAIAFGAPDHFRSYRVQLSAPDLSQWGLAELVFQDKGQEVRVAGPGNFSSAWMSAGSGEEWVYVDLGAHCTFDRVVLTWIRPAVEGSIQVSEDAREWKTVASLPAAGPVDDMRLPHPAEGRYVRLLLLRPGHEGERYVLSEMEVYGRGGPVVVPHGAAVPAADGSLALAGGAWRLQRASLVTAPGAEIASAGYKDADWMVATVPGTVLTSFLNDGAVPDPDFSDNQYAISDAYFCADFWYRDEFTGPAGLRPGQHVWLNFDGINWKAIVYFNGKELGRIDGGFMRGRFDVTSLLRAGRRNALAVRILANDNPGSTKDKADRTVNGGALGRDNPTFHASAGWDWMSTIRGRDTGIWNNVTLTTTGPVTVEHPLVTTTLPLPSTSSADVSLEADLHNQETHPVTGVVAINFGAIRATQTITIPPSSSKSVRFTPESFPALHIAHPRLWWPVGYGDPNLYPVTVSFIAGGRTSDVKHFRAGIRQFTYSEDGGVLKIWINGRRLIARGGNWGFSESMLRYRAREYDTAMRYHRDEHFNMIRNWVGQTGDEAFYDAADRFGIVIWQDFWLANPWDGPDPDDNALFLANARDYLLRIRNHASLGLFCGRNEGFPPQPIDDGLRSMVAALRPGSHYISSSADGPVSGHGPYRVEPLRYYFEHSPSKMHSEIGAPNVPEMRILNRTMPGSAQWPRESQWTLHDFYPENPFATAVDEQFGGATNMKEWDSLAQFVDYDAYRGMFEGQSRNRLGLLIWMSHPAWPSLLWQTYDYFFDTDAAYYGAKKGAEPLHIQWNAASDAVEVVNMSAGDQEGLTARAEVLNVEGSVRWQKSVPVHSMEDSTISAFQIEYPVGLSPTHFLRLALLRGNRVLSSNFYLRGVTENDYRAIREMPPAKVSLETRMNRHGSQWRITVTLRNVSMHPALMIRVKAVRDKSGDLILPALYSDNYIALMPHETRVLSIELENADTRGERPRVILEGFNVAGIR